MNELESLVGWMMRVLLFPTSASFQIATLRGQTRWHGPSWTMQVQTRLAGHSPKSDSGVSSPPETPHTPRYGSFEPHDPGSCSSFSSSSSSSPIFRSLPACPLLFFSSNMTDILALTQPAA